MKTLAVTFEDTTKVNRRLAEGFNGQVFENQQALIDSLTKMFGEDNFGIVELADYQREMNDTDDDYQSPFLDGWVSFVTIRDEGKHYVKVDEDAKTIDVNGNVLSFEEVSLAYAVLASTVNQRIERESTGSEAFKVILTQSFSLTFTVKADSAEDAIDYVDGCLALFTEADYVSGSSVAEVLS